MRIMKWAYYQGAAFSGDLTDTLVGNTVVDVAPDKLGRGPVVVGGAAH